MRLARTHERSCGRRDVRGLARGDPGEQVVDRLEPVEQELGGGKPGEPARHLVGTRERAVQLSACSLELGKVGPREASRSTSPTSAASACAHGGGRTR